MPGLDAFTAQARRTSALERMVLQERDDLAIEVAALRREIAALRADLTSPTSSAILVGPKVLEEFKRLQSTIVEARP